MLGEDPCKVSLYSVSGNFLADLTRYLVAGAFSRRSNAISNFTGNFVLDQSSCVDLERIDFWSTYIVCERDGRDQWSGPVTNVVFNEGNLEVVASDKGAYWSRAEVSNSTFNVVDVTQIASTLIYNAFETNLYGMPIISASFAGTVLSASFSVGDHKSLLDALGELKGLNWTFFGSTVFLSGTFDNETSVIKLNDRSWYPLPSVERAGQIYANRVVVVGKGVVGIAEAPLDETQYYGLITRRYNEPDLTTQAAVNFSAMDHLARCRDSTFLNVDGGSVLSPKVDVSLEELIPGNFVEIDHRVSGFPMSRRMRIDGVDVDCVTGKVGLILEPLAVPDEETLG